MGQITPFPVRSFFRVCSYINRNESGIALGTVPMSFNSSFLEQVWGVYFYLLHQVLFFYYQWFGNHCSLVLEGSLQGWVLNTSWEAWTVDPQREHFLPSHPWSEGKGPNRTDLKKKKVGTKVQNEACSQIRSVEWASTAFSMHWPHCLGNEVQQKLAIHQSHYWKESFFLLGGGLNEEVIARGRGIAPVSVSFYR